MVLIIAEGDSLTYGQDTTSSGQSTQINGASQTRSITPYPEALGLLLGERFTVENHGFPGDRTIEGLVRWQNSATAALTFLMFGTNDAFNGGGASTGPLNLDTYASVLSLLVERRKHQGGAVVILFSPPVQNAEGDLKLKRYEDVARHTASHHNVPLINTRAVLSSTPNPWSDGVHLSPTAYAELARAARPVAVELLGQ